MTNEPTLYIIMRDDLDSMNPGKAMAQASHAYGAVKQAVRSKLTVQPSFHKWMAQTDQEFGTTIVLRGDIKEIEEALQASGILKVPIVTGMVHDPTYPVKDGDFTHLIPLNTCGFVFGLKEDCQHVTQNFFLHD